jgi:hypothetical protein
MAATFCTARSKAITWHRNMPKQIGCNNAYSRDMPSASELSFRMSYKGILQLSEHNLRNSVNTFDAHFTQLCVLLNYSIQAWQQAK